MFTEDGKELTKSPESYTKEFLDIRALSPRKEYFLYMEQPLQVSKVQLKEKQKDFFSFLF